MNYVSFATTITSLFLGVIAIFYSMISNQAFSETTGSLKESVNNIQIAAQNISETSSNLLEQTGQMMGEISDLPPAFKEISAKIDALSVPQREAIEKTGKAGKVSAQPYLLQHSTIAAVVVSTYIIACAIRTEKRIVTAEIFAPLSEWDFIIAGVLHGLRAAAPLGLKLDFSKQEASLVFSVSDKGTMEWEEIIKYVETSANKTIMSKKKTVDQYFS
jgi:hypothetical protein